MEKKPDVCQICGEVIDATRSWQKYCKKKQCQNKANSNRVARCRKILPRTVWICNACKPSCELKTGECQSEPFQCPKYRLEADWKVKEKVKK